MFWLSSAPISSPILITRNHRAHYADGFGAATSALVTFLDDGWTNAFNCTGTMERRTAGTRVTAHIANTSTAGGNTLKLSVPSASGCWMSTIMRGRNKKPPGTVQINGVSTIHFIARATAHQNQHEGEGVRPQTCVGVHSGLVTTVAFVILLVATLGADHSMIALALRVLAPPQHRTRHTTQQGHGDSLPKHTTAIGSASHSHLSPLHTRPDAPVGTHFACDANIRYRITA